MFAKGVILGILALATSVGGLVTSPGEQAAPQSDERTFSASWSATGTRHAIPTEKGRPATVFHLTGAVVLTVDVRGLSTAFHGEAIGFDDSAQLNAGRAVWTDSRGNRVFSVLRGEPLAGERRIFGTFTGGTGPYTGITGDYELTWQYFFQHADQSIQGRAVDLRGRFRLPGARNE
jgi:hypothetical protein